MSVDEETSLRPHPSCALHGPESARPLLVVGEAENLDRHGDARLMILCPGREEQFANKAYGYWPLHHVTEESQTQVRRAKGRPKGGTATLLRDLE